MKKFLFTLATLLMAGSAFAAEVTTINHEFTADEIGKQFLLPINLVVDNEYVNGWDFTMTYPEGLTVGTVKVNSAVLNQTVPSNVDGDDAVVTPMGEAKADHIVGAYGTAGYWDPDDDGVFESYGAVKLGPTGTIKMYEIRITPTAEFTGGDVTIEWMVSGGFDPRNGQDGSLQVRGTAVAHLTVAAAPQQKEDCESPSVMGATGENGEYYIQITPDPETDGALQYTVDKDPKRVEVVDGITYLYYDRGEADVPVHVVAWTAEGQNYNASAEEVKDITIPKLDQVKTPVVSYTMGEGNTIIISASCETEGATVTLYNPEGNAVEMPATVSYDPYVGYDAIWTAKATAPYMLDSETGENHIVITADEKKTVESPSIMGMKHDGSKKLYDIIITPDPATDGELEYTVNPEGTVLRADAVTIQYERKAEPYTVAVTAKTLEGATCKESALAEETITVPALDQVETPEITWTPAGEGKFEVSASCDTEGATVTLYDPAGNPTTNPVTVTYDPAEGYNKTWTAKATATDMLDSETASKTIVIAPEEEKVYYANDPVISNPEITEDAYIYTVTGDGVVTVTVTIYDENGNPVAQEPVTGENTVTVTIPRTDDDQYVNIVATNAPATTPEGYDSVVPGQDSKTYEVVEAKVYTAAPTIVPTTGHSTWDEAGNQTNDGHYVNIEIVNNDEGQNVVIQYSYDGENWVTYTDDWNISENGDYVIYARAKADGKSYSEVVSIPVHIDEATSVNELTNGKTVAGVRYFNMAGQEMQEANGITIVVTTYTDGTTSAVKVIK